MGVCARVGIAVSRSIANAAFFDEIKNKKSIKNFI